MCLAQNGTLTARLAANPAEIDASQKLRYQVFFEEMSATPNAIAGRTRRDVDGFDDYCDHLLVICQTTKLLPGSVKVKEGKLVGTYRLLPQGLAEQNSGFYSQQAFDIDGLIARKPNHLFLELGRSCVGKAYRTKPVIELLWQAIWNYLRLHNLDVMIGCASLEGTNLDSLRMPLGLLQQKFRAPTDWLVEAHKDRRIDIVFPPLEKIDTRSAFKALPPLIKGYLRLGAYVGEGVVFDEHLNTTDILIVLPVEAINPRYFARFGYPDEEFD